MDSKANLSSASRKAEKAFTWMDNAARAAMKFSSALLLIAEMLANSFRQVGGDRRSVPKDTSILVNLLDPLSRLAFDQFSRVAVRSVQKRRDLLMDVLVWPMQDIKRRFLDFWGTV